MIRQQKPAKSVTKSSKRKKILIGHAERISPTGVARCGGAAANEIRTLLAVSTLNMRAKKTRTMKMIKMGTTKIMSGR